MHCATQIKQQEESRVEDSAWSLAERRTLGGVLGFLAGMAALGPIAGVAAAVLGAAAAALTESR